MQSANWVCDLVYILSDMKTKDDQVWNHFVNRIFTVLAEVEDGCKQIKHEARSMNSEMTEWRQSS